jgi:hypothetical protein
MKPSTILLKLFESRHETGSSRNVARLQAVSHLAETGPDTHGYVEVREHALQVHVSHKFHCPVDAVAEAANVAMESIAHQLFSEVHQSVRDARMALFTHDYAAVSKALDAIQSATSWKP